MQSLSKVLQNRELYRRKIRQLPRERSQVYADILRVIVLSETDIIDALIATYFERQTGVSPISTLHRIPSKLMPVFEDDRQFFCYLSDLLKRRCMG